MAWLTYFEDTPKFLWLITDSWFFMITIKPKHSCKKKLAKNIRKIILKWADLRVDPLSPQIASIGADFHKDLTFAKEKTIPVDGYFTAIAVLTTKGWKLWNAHWPVKIK